MVLPQTVVGFFENVAEAQAAVQVLLAGGISPERLTLSTHTGQNTSLTRRLPTDEASRTGRFFATLFGSNDIRTADGQTRRDGALIAVQVQSVAEAARVADWLSGAGAAEVTTSTHEDEG